ncbi:T-cell immunoreceptor with Ig and ITIM domains isoform X1 [Castor canadensis]|uniref:T-cell immunoreceptor with Ig and ITIM domains isoform X1 n=1 Tax=Castor canadensis TaxID=51338 RepID=UPI003D163510
MHHGLLLTWAQALSQAAFLTSGAMKGKIVTKGNISAEEGDSVILQCHLSSTTAKVTQINWELQDQLLASYHTDFGWYIDPGFRERVAPGPSLGLTFQSLTTNDSGEYFCIYHTYPDGIYKGRISLEVLGRSVAEHSTWIPIPLLGAVAIVLGVICITVIGVVVFTRKVTALVAHSNCGHPILTSLVLYVPFLPRERPRYDLPCTLCFFLSTCSLSSAFVYVLPHPSFRLGAPGRLDLHPICFAVTYSYSFLSVL